MRTIIDLPEEQIHRLASLGRQVHASRAELVRRAVAEFLQHHPTTEEESAFGIWSGRTEESLDYQRRLREEWEG